MRYGNRRVDLYLSQGGFGHWGLCLAVIQGEWKRLPMMLCGKKFALVRSVTSLTGAFAGNFVDFQWDFFILQALAVV